ncbi:MAG: hypothetical protein K8J31_29675 [Anaerolineae bacterium]|nr:hypothetical protein [Anaerolineae bacterium]
MIRQFAEHQRVWFAFIISALIVGVPVQIGAAQSTGFSLVQTAEYDLGFDCPVTSALDAAGTTLWVLMDNCGRSGYSLHAYHVADGTALAMDDYADALQSLVGTNNYIDPFSTPMGFTPAGDLSIHYTNFDDSSTSTLLIPLASGGEATTETSASYNALLAEYSDYPDFSVYSPNHTRVVAAGETSFHVLDVQTETEIVEIPVEGSTDSAAASFSADGERLEVVHYQSMDSVSDHSATLLIYSLPDGALLKQYSLPSSPVWISPDEAYAAVSLWSNNVGDVNELVVINLETGLTSPAVSLNEDPAPVATCLNNGHDVRDVNFMTSGRFSFPDLHWLTDSSSLIVPLSYNGEGAAGSGSLCIFNYSRLRTYRVEDAG